VHFVKSNTQRFPPSGFKEKGIRKFEILQIKLGAIGFVVLIFYGYIIYHQNICKRLEHFAN